MVPLVPGLAHVGVSDGSLDVELEISMSLFRCAYV